MPDSSKAPNAIDLDTYLPALIITLGNKISLHAAREAAQAHGLDVREWRVMLILGADGKSTINEVADRVAMDRGGTSRSISRLEERGLIRRFDDPGDRRRSLVDLTPKGGSLHDTLAAAAHEREAELLADLDKAERGQLVASLSTLIAQMDEMLRKED